MSQIELTDIDDAKAEVAELTAVLQEQIELLKMAQAAVKREMVTDLAGGSPVLHRDVAAKLTSLTKSMAEAGRVQVIVAKAHKELAGSMTAEDRVKATARYLMTLTNPVLNALLDDVLTHRRSLAEAGEAVKKPKTAQEAIAALVTEVPSAAD
jgi:hypothetical protein